VLDPDSLIAVARLLASSPGTPEMVEAQLRRAISTAYYAVFHALMQRAAMRFMGPEHETTAGYRLMYRSFEHGRVLQICRELSARTLSVAMRRDLGRQAISDIMQEFARTLPDLQSQRHDADYDPAMVIDHAIVIELINTAEAAIAAFDGADPGEQADILALMMTRRRV